MTKYNTNYIRTKEYHNDAEYISVNGFNRNRRKSNLKELLYFYLDLDITNTKLFNDIVFKYKNIEDVDINLFNEQINKEYINLILERCQKLEIPKPTKINNSGNGFHVYWEIKEHSKAVKFKKFYGASFMQISAYELIEKSLVDKFLDLGADKRATDSTRLLRQEGSFNTSSNTICSEIYTSDTIVSFSEIANKLLKYTYEETVEYKKITKKQKEFLVKNKIVTPQKAWRLNKFQAKKLIDEFIKSERNASDKQKEYLNILNISYDEHITIEEADFLIKQEKAKKSHNYDYIHRLLTKVLNYGDVTVGNRAYFFYYLAISSRRLDLDISQAIIKAKEFNKSINFSEDELIYHTRQAYTDKITLNIKISTILTHLSLDPIKYSTKKKTVQKRAKKGQIELAYKKFKLNFYKYISLSVRKVADELNISKTTVAKFKKQFKEEVENKSKIKEEIANKLKEIIADKMDFKSMDRISIIRIKNGFKIYKKECPLIL